MDLTDKIAAHMKVGDTIKITTLMRKFRASRDDVETAVEDLNQTRGGFDLIVGGQITGVGYWHDKRTDYEVERYQ